MRGVVREEGQLLLLKVVGSNLVAGIALFHYRNFESGLIAKTERKREREMREKREKTKLIVYFVQFAFRERLVFDLASCIGE